MTVNPSETSDNQIELSMVLPCLNETETLAACIHKTKRWRSANHVQGEVIVADNGSTDGSREIAAKLGPRMEPIAARG